MRTDTDLLTLAQWLSPSFPVGAYSYSHGLEAAVQHGAVSDAASVVGWIDAVLRFGSGRSDALFLAAAYRSDSPARLWEVESACRAFAPSKERLMETTLQSEAFCKTVAEVWDLEVAVLGYPVAVGRATRLRGIAQDAAAQFYLHAFLSNLAGAAMRLSVVGQTDGQRLI